CLRKRAGKRLAVRRGFQGFPVCPGHKAGREIALPAVVDAGCPDLLPALPEVEALLVPDPGLLPVSARRGEVAEALVAFRQVSENREVTRILSVEPFKDLERPPEVPSGPPRIAPP